LPRFLFRHAKRFRARHWTPFLFLRSARCLDRQTAAEIFQVKTLAPDPKAAVRAAKRYFDVATASRPASARCFSRSAPVRHWAIALRNSYPMPELAGSSDGLAWA